MKSKLFNQINLQSNRNHSFEEQDSPNDAENYAQNLSCPIDDI